MQQLNKLNIPKTISVGFQERKGTYTGKLAFVVYKDAKGVLRKEKSWDGWRDKKIAPKEFENVPTSGFVLNKKVGETRWGWNPRKAWVRVYDPRDFEFEISVANLLFILEECSSIQGKGLEGEFVYSWDGSELVLLPVNSQEYKSSSKFSTIQTQKVTAVEMQEGCIYLHKDNKELMYLGRHDWYDHPDEYSNKIEYDGKKHIFVSLDGKSNYQAENGFTKLAAKLTHEPSSNFADEYEKFTKSGYCSMPVGVTGLPVKFQMPDSNYVHQKYFVKDGPEKYHTLGVGCQMQYQSNESAARGESPIKKYSWTKSRQPLRFVTKTLKNKAVWSVTIYTNDQISRGLSKEKFDADLSGMQLYELHYKCANGGTRPVFPKDVYDDLDLEDDEY